jgi:signal transduction histidine kinase/CheY-like chemotaxis protein
MTSKDSLKGNQDLILSAIEAMGHGLAIWNADGTFVVCNRNFRSQYQPRGFDLVDGVHIKDLFAALVKSGELISAKSEQEFAEAEITALNQQSTSEYIFADGSVFKTERRVLPEGKIGTFSQDITEIKRSERKLKSFLEQAELIDKSKSRFLRAANHDLRQPLASLKILIYNCMNARDEDNHAELLHAMDVSVSIMEDLLGALLNIGQLDAGKVEPRITTFQISTLIDRLEVQFSQQAIEKGLRFKLVSSNSAVTSDRALLERVISNFVGNALKYTETGGVVVGCRPDGNNLRIEVWDTGCGISAEHQDAIFEEFFRVSDSQDHQKHSLGLGLNISKRLADVLEHPIRIRSELGVGSVFSISVPIGDIWHSDIGEPEISERIGGEFTGLKALVLEDDEILQNALQELLERWGISVVCFATVPDSAALSELLTPPPNFIVTDYRLKGGVEGTDAVEKIRAFLGTPCPTIVVTADTAPKVIETIKAKGFPVLIKPVSPPRLRVMIHNILFEPELLDELGSKKRARP